MKGSKTNISPTIQHFVYFAGSSSRRRWRSQQKRLRQKIYISDGLTLFAFSEEGELALCLEKRGEAPDEYSGISDFVIDGENIIILDRNQQKTITYDHSGNSISTFHLKYYAQAISPLVNNTFFLYNGFDKDPTNKEPDSLLIMKKNREH